MAINVVVGFNALRLLWLLTLLGYVGFILWWLFASVCMHKMSGSRAGSTSSKMEKRKITLTAKALASKIELIQKQRKEEVNKLKSQILSLKELMGDDQNVSQVKAQFDVLLQASEKATAFAQISDAFNSIWWTRKTRCMVRKHHRIQSRIY